MSLRVYNVLKHKKEEFIPIDEKNIKMYACGITASGDAHIGHAYQAIIFDTIKRYLEYIGYHVTYVRNYTDVDDKIILRARELGINPRIFAEDKMNRIDEDLKKLGVEKPTIQSKATECIPDMINFIKKLVEKGCAYSTNNGDVFFKVSSFQGYGKLSNRIIENNISGVRKDVEPGKLDDRDFALWKSAKDDEIFWDSPWGKGRPGWHIECSTMSMKYLGETLDIHGGGRDLIFPHHENEIAQSESLTGKTFSNYWLHNGLIKINGQKMSKSLGNGILLRDLLKQYNPEVIRMTLLENNYRSDMNIIDGIFEQHEGKVYAFYKMFCLIDKIGNNIVPNENSAEFKKIDMDFRNTMDNDFNTAVAISNLYNYINEFNKLIKQGNIEKCVNMKHAIVKIYSVLGLLQQNPKMVIDEIKDKYLKLQQLDVDKIKKLIDLRTKLKNEKMYIEADEIRDKLIKMGVIVKDVNSEVEWDLEIPPKKDNKHCKIKQLHVRI